MNEKLMAGLTDPVKGRIILEVQRQEQATASQLLKRLQDVPQATLYRHLKRLLDDGVLQVVQERKVRNVIEKTYKCDLDFGSLEAAVLANSGEVYAAWFYQYMLGFLQEFSDYGKRPDIDIAGDGSGFSLMPFYATAEELNEMGRKIQEVIAPYYANDATPERKLRNLGVIFTPPKA